MKSCFLPADILLPATASMDHWAVIACDQFTSDRDYWNRVRSAVGQDLSTLQMILPEAELSIATQDTIPTINQNMIDALNSGAFTCYPDSFVYVERTLQNGTIRQGVVGVVDLEHYDFQPGTNAAVRATEQTVTERIPPRVAIRKNAALEFSHVILFCDDPGCSLIESVAAKAETLPKLYDFDLLEKGGHIRGFLLNGAAGETFRQALDAYTEACGAEAAFLVADGNHSLATAKRCYEDLKLTLPEDQWKNLPARYATVELENIHSPVIAFEPIHRVITDLEPTKLLTAMEAVSVKDGCPMHYVTAGGEGTVNLPGKPGEMQVAILQRFLDAYLQENPVEIDYIHDEDALRNFATKPKAIGFLLENMDKSELFNFVASGNTLPRKTFSLGHAVEKRYYLEGRKIR